MNRARILTVMLAVAVVILAIGSVAAEAPGEGALTCPICNVTFKTPQEAARHAIEHHGAKGCAVCGVLFKDDVEASAHAIIHHQAKQCTACGKTFADNAEAQLHLIQGHGFKGCTICRRAFETDEEAAAHAKMHEQTAKKKTLPKEEMQEKKPGDVR